MIIAIILIIIVASIWIYLASQQPGPFTTLMQEERAITIDSIAAHKSLNNHWKTVVYIQYKDNILMLKYKDHSFIEYYNDHGTWRKMPSMKKVNNDTVSLIEDYFINFPKLKQGRGGSKSFT